jgi:hypothetical protein
MIEISAKVDFSQASQSPPVKYNRTKEQQLPSYTIVESENKQTQKQPMQTVVKNFITTGSSEAGEITQTTFTQTVKQNSEPAPSPATALKVQIPQGYQIKSGSESIYINGMLQTEGSSNDYTMSGNTITFAFDIESSDAVVVKYTLSSTG